MRESEPFVPDFLRSVEGRTLCVVASPAREERVLAQAPVFAGLPDRINVTMAELAHRLQTKTSPSRSCPLNEVVKTKPPYRVEEADRTKLPLKAA